MLLKYSLLILCIMTLSMGQVLFKISAQTLKTSSLLGLMFEPYFILALFLYALTTMGWVWSLQDIPLSRAYLFMALAFIFVPFLSYFFFNEQLSLQYLLGVLLIIAGIICSIL